MNAVSLEPSALPSPLAAVAEPAEGLDDVTRSRRAAWHLLAIITAFWVYVTLSNVLYIGTLSAGIDPSGTANYFASWEPRVLQHLLLYPVLVGCLWISLRVGWRPLWRAIPIQLMLSLVFAVSATPLLALSENVVSPDGWRVLLDLPKIFAPLFSGTRKSLWIAGFTSFELTYGFALALVMGFVLYRRFRNSELRLVELERAWSEARLGALRAQLSPHTLFNLLHTIRGQIGWDPAAAQSMIVQLGDLLRGLLAAGEREFSLLRQELQFARVYLQLQRQRFADRVKLSLPDIETLPSVWVPSLILQPLIENAIVHGLTGHDGEVLIQLEVAVENEVLVLRLTNSVATSRSGDRLDVSGTGIGLRNIRERLAVHFGDRSRFTAGLDEGQRWRAEMRLPLLPVV